MKKVFERLSRSRGNVSQLKTYQACRNLKEKGLLIEFWESPRFSYHDRVGKDFFLVPRHRRQPQKIWFQVKSSRYGVQEHLKKSSIPVILVKTHYPVELVEKILIQAFHLNPPPILKSPVAV